MAKPTSRPSPNVADPLSEPTVGRRLWAAYLKAGYNRNQFAKALGKAYTTIDKWDTGVSTPTLGNLTAAAKLVDYSVEELVHGKAVERDKRLQPELDQQGILAVLLELNANGAQRAALGDHIKSDAGTFQRITRAYVTAFVTAYGELLAQGKPRAQAMEHAIIEADRARGLADAVARGVTLDVQRVAKAKRKRPPKAELEA